METKWRRFLEGIYVMELLRARAHIHTYSSIWCSWDSRATAARYVSSRYNKSYYSCSTRFVIIHRSAELPLSTVRFSSPCFSESRLSRSRRSHRRIAATTLRICRRIPSSPLSRASRPRRNTSSPCSLTRILFRLERRRRARLRLARASPAPPWR